MIILAAARHVTPAANLAGWLIVIALLALALWGLAKWIRR